MSKAFENYVPRMATPDMTAEMEAEMDQIAAGEMTKDEVLKDSRDMLRSAFDEMGDDVKTEDEDAKWRKFAREVWAGMDQDRILGPCIVCEEAGRKQEDGSPNMLRIIKARKSGKRFVGCSGWDGDNPDSPDSCDTTFPLPQRVRGLYKIEEVCSVCGRTPRLQVVPWRGRPWKLCLNDECPSMAEMKRRRAEREAAKAAKEAAEAAAKDGKADGRTRRRPSEAVKEAEKIAGPGVCDQGQARPRQWRQGQERREEGRRQVGQRLEGQAPREELAGRSTPPPSPGHRSRMRALPIRGSGKTRGLQVVPGNGHGTDGRGG